MASSTRDHQSRGGRSEREERGRTTRRNSNRRRSPSVPERMCATPVDERDLEPSHRNDPGRHPSRSPERERSSNNQGETARSSDRERSHNQRNSSATESGGRASRRNTGEVSYLSLENESRETLPPPYATLPPPGENRIPIVLRRQDTNPPPYATTAPSGSENRIPIVLRRPHSSPLLPNADPLSPWQRNRTPPMARQYTLPFRPHNRPDSRNYNIRIPEFIPYANQRGNPNFEPARLPQFGMRYNLNYPVNRYQNTFSHHYYTSLYPQEMRSRCSRQPPIPVMPPMSPMPPMRRMRSMSPTRPISPIFTMRHRDLLSRTSSDWPPWSSSESEKSRDARRCVIQ
jgi:hypothetical protein